MTRRGVSLGSMLSSIAKLETEKRLGKLRFVPNHYVLSDEGYTNASGVWLKPFTDKQGNMASLRKGRGHSRCPEPPIPSPLLDRGYSVSYSTCSRCPAYIKGGFCRKLRTGQTAEEAKTAGVLEAFSILSNTVTEVNKMLNS